MAHLTYATRASYNYSFAFPSVCSFVDKLNQLIESERRRNINLVCSLTCGCARPPDAAVAGFELKGHVSTSVRAYRQIRRRALGILPRVATPIVLCRTDGSCRQPSENHVSPCNRVISNIWMGETTPIRRQVCHIDSLCATQVAVHEGWSPHGAPPAQVRSVWHPSCKRSV